MVGVAASGAASSFLFLTMLPSLITVREILPQTYLSEVNDTELMEKVKHASPGDPLCTFLPRY
jgi:hypothetical protein